ncbi:MAG: tol-pal system protein YbgF [Candidatus Adiutrix sp.]
MILNKAAIWALIPFFFIFGCNGAPGTSSSLQREVNTLKMEVADLKDQSPSSAGRGAAGNSYTEIGELRTSVQRLTENVETASMGGLTLRQQLEFINARLDRLEKQTKLSPLDPKVVTYSPPAVLGISSYDGPSAYTPPPAAGGGLYEEGKALFDQKDYEAALQQLRAYLAAEPKGTNAAAAQFYIGESLYAQQKHEEAILEYQKVIQGFPKSSQVPTALLKQGLSFQAINDKDSAKLLYQKIIASYPKSYAAGVARERLKTI